MNKKQWYVLSGTSFILAGLFMTFAQSYNLNCSLFGENTAYNIIKCVGSDLFLAFIFIFLALGIALFVCARIEPKNKK